MGKINAYYNEIILTSKDIERFWEKVDRRGESDCWTWLAAKSSKRYGRFRLQGKLYLPHRISYFLAKGELKGLEVCHTCDNPPCCNPAHLFLGTRSDNMKDAAAKGRLISSYTAAVKTGKFFYKGGGGSRKGQQNHFSKLKEEDVLKIRELSEQGQNSIVLSKIFDVTPQHIRWIVRRKSWNHI